MVRPPQWEYTTALIEVGGWVSARVDPEAVKAELNRYGAQDWELVSAFDVNDSNGRTSNAVRANVALQQTWPVVHHRFSGSAPTRASALRRALGGGHAAELGR